MKLSTRLTTVTPLLTRLASWKLWIMSAAIFVPFAWMFFGSSAPFAIPAVEAACGQAPPDMAFFTSADGVTQFLSDCGPDGRDTYRNMQLADLFYPAIVGVFMTSSLILAVRRLSPRPGWAVWLGAVPLASIAFDYLENVLAWMALASYPSSTGTSHLLGVASAAKTTSSWAAGLLLFAALIAIVVQETRTRLRPESNEAPVASDSAIEREVVRSAS